MGVGAQGVRVILLPEPNAPFELLGFFRELALVLCRFEGVGVRLLETISEELAVRFEDWDPKIQQKAVNSMQTSKSKPPGFEKH